MAQTSTSLTKPYSSSYVSLPLLSFFPLSSFVSTFVGVDSRCNPPPWWGYLPWSYNMCFHIQQLRALEWLMLVLRIWKNVAYVLSIFQDNEKVKVLIECQHVYHSRCLDLWLSSHSSCPLCRASLHTCLLIL